MQYNGNISETIWRTANDVSDNKTRAYAYQYDALSRITGADYGIKTTTSFNLASGFDMGVGLYDKNGNIKSLWRDNMSNTKIDNLTYTYANGDASNKLLNVEDSSGSPEGFKNGATLATEYTYDGNGNLKEDKNKGITNIIYNHLNLPSQITFASGKIEYFYDAVGTKQKKKVTNGTVITTTDYAGNYIYRNNALQFISQPEGYLELDGQGGYDYTYQYKDHLGNIRLSYKDISTTSIPVLQILEENNYYPFGLKHSGYNMLVFSANLALKYKYNGKELQDDLIGSSSLDLYDYGARMYDPALGRFHTQDRFAEKYESITPYQYGANNPILYIDINGDSLMIEHKGERIMYQNGNLTFAGTNKKYNGKALNKNGKLKGFVGASVKALDKIRTGGEAGKELISNLQNDTHPIRILSGGDNGAKGLVVTWNSHSTDGGLDENGGVNRPSYIGLAHELAHTQDELDGGQDGDEWFPNPIPGERSIPNAEKYATHWENMIRAENAVALRAYYSTGVYAPARILNGTSSLYNQQLKVKVNIFPNGKLFIPYVSIVTQTVGSYKYR